MAELLKRIIQSNRPNVHIEDLKIKLRNTGDSIDLLTQNFDGTHYRTLDQIGASRDLDIAVANGFVRLYDEGGNLLTGTEAFKATNLATLRDGGTGSGTTAGTATGTIKSGLQAVTNGTDTVSIVFASAFASANYGVTGLLVNASDSPPSIYSHIVQVKSTTGFTVLFSGIMDSVNYTFAWISHLE